MLPVMIVQNGLELAHIHRAILSGEPLERAVEREGQSANRTCPPCCKNACACPVARTVCF